jgi:hypothetical protein
MKAFIGWIFFEYNNLRYLIKNNENNENWPNSSAFLKINKVREEKIDNQQIKL